MVIWITGLSGSGKTTLCETLVAILKNNIPELFHVDGDVVREMYGHDIDHSEMSRIKQICRIQTLARLLDDQGMVVVVAALYANPELLKWNRQHFDSYFEIYLEADIEFVKSRDPKGLYAKAEAGKMPNVVGIDIPWHAPQCADLTLTAATGSTPEEFARQIIAQIPRFSEAVKKQNQAST